MPEFDWGFSEQDPYICNETYDKIQELTYFLNSEPTNVKWEDVPHHMEKPTIGFNTIDTEFLRVANLR